MDKELFDLCKQVYEKTEWKQQHDWYMTDTASKTKVTYISHEGMTKNTPDWYTEHCPAYDSDYLLGKLPKFSPVAKGCYLTVMEKQTPKDKREDFYWTAGYFCGDGWSFTGQSDTPLKALLRLTLALSEAGEL